MPANNTITLVYANNSINDLRLKINELVLEYNNYVIKTNTGGYYDFNSNVAVDGYVTADNFIGNTFSGVSNTALALNSNVTIELTGDVNGSFSFDGSSNITFTTTIQENSVELGVDTIGKYVRNVFGSNNQIYISGDASETSDIVLTLPQNVHSSANVVFNSINVNEGLFNTISANNITISSNTLVENLNTDLLDGQHGSYYLNWNNATNKPSPKLDINLSGDVSGSANAVFSELANSIINVNVTVSNDSHTHDGRYYTETEADERFINADGDYLNGNLNVNGSISINGNVDGVDISQFKTDFETLLSREYINTNPTFGTVVIEGDLTVSGNVTTIDVETIAIADNKVELNSNFTTGVPTEDSGVIIRRGDYANAEFYWDESEDSWHFDNSVIFDGVLTINSESDASIIYDEVLNSFIFNDNIVIEGGLELSSNTLVENLNADLLDDHEGDYYLNWNNATNKPSPKLDINLTGDVVASGNSIFTDLSNTSINIPISLQSANSSAKGVLKIIDSVTNTNIDVAISANTAKYLYDELQNKGDSNSYYTTTEIDILLTSFYSNTYIENNFLGKNAQATDSDKLDGQHGTYYLDWDNISNKPSPKLDINLTGDVSGIANVVFTDVSNASMNINVAVSNDSHTHDERYYTEDEIDTLIAGYYSNTEVDNLLSNYYSNTEVDNLLSNYYSNTEVDNLIANVEVDLSGYYSNTEVNSLLANYQTIVSGVSNTEIGYLSNVTSDVQAQLNTKLSKGVVEIVVTDPSAEESITTGDGKAYFIVPNTLDGKNLIDADAAVTTPSTSGNVTIDVYNVNNSNSMLSTNITIDSSENTSYTASTQPVIDTSNDDVSTGDIIRIDIDGAGTNAKGLIIILTFE